MVAEAEGPLPPKSLMAWRVPRPGTGKRVHWWDSDDEDGDNPVVVMDSGCNHSVASPSLEPHITNRQEKQGSVVGVSGVSTTAGTGDVVGLPESISNVLIINGAQETLWNMGGLVDAFELRFEGDSTCMRFYRKGVREPVLVCHRRTSDKLWVCHLEDLQKIDPGVRALGSRRRDYSTEEKDRALRLWKLHCISHPSDVTLHEMITHGVYSHLGLGAEDLRVMKELVGPCPACEDAKKRAWENPSSVSEPAREPGQYWHCDFKDMDGGTLLVAVDDKTSLVQPLKLSNGKHKTSVQDSYSDLIRFNNQYRRDMERVMFDSETAFKECMPWLREASVVPKYTIPGKHEKKVERKIGTLGPRISALKLSLRYELSSAAHPTVLREIDIFMAAAVYLNLESNKVTQGISPWQMFTGEANPLLRFPEGWMFGFGTIVQVKEKHGPEFGVILFPDLNTAGGYVVRFPQWKGRGVEQCTRAAKDCTWVHDQLPPMSWGWQLRESLTFDRGVIRGPVNRTNQRELNSSSTHPAPVSVLGGDIEVPLQSSTGPIEVPLQSTGLPRNGVENVSSESRPSEDELREVVSARPPREGGIVSTPPAQVQVEEVTSAVQPSAGQETVVEELREVSGTPTVTVTKSDEASTESILERLQEGISVSMEKEGTHVPVNDSRRLEVKSAAQHEESVRPRRAAANQTWREGPAKDRSLRSYFTAVFSSNTHRTMKKKKKGKNQMSYEKYIKFNPERGSHSMQVELDNWDKFEAAVACDPKKLTKEEWNEVLPSWAFTLDKEHTDGSYNKTKTRLVINGKMQDASDLGALYSPTVDTVSVFVALAILAAMKGEAFVYDVTGAFLHKSIEADRKPIYVRISKDMADEWVKRHPEADQYRLSDGGLILRLLKYVYGLKEAPRKFHDMLIKALTDAGYTATISDRCLTVKEDSEGNKVIATLHVDDELGVVIGEKLRDDLLKTLQKVFGKEVSCKPLDEYLGMKIEYDKVKGTVTINQQAYWEKALLEYELQDMPVFKTPALDDIFEVPVNNTPVDRSLYQSMVMKALWGARLTKPEILLAVTFLSGKCQDPVQSDMDKLVRVYGYIKGTAGLKRVIRPRGLSLGLHADAAFGVHPDGRSHGGLVVTIGGAPVLIKCSKIRSVKISSTGAENAMLCEGCTYLRWLAGMMRELGFGDDGPHIAYQDNESAIKQTTSECQFRRSKQDLIQMAYVRELVMDGELVLVHLPTDEMMADILTKPLQGSKFRYLRDKLLGILDIDGRSNV